MDEILQKKLNDAVWVAHSLFERGKTSGSSANLSILHNGTIYISASGTCFGTLSVQDFAAVSMGGKAKSSLKPSKELPLHRYYYESHPQIQAIVHTHSPYTVLWSCRKFTEGQEVIPAYTPYLEMKVGKIGLIPFAKPGSEELFRLFRENLAGFDAYILKNHGGIVGGKSIMDAFFGIEELEESAKIACMIEKTADYEKIGVL